VVVVVLEVERGILVVLEVADQLVEQVLLDKALQVGVVVLVIQVTQVVVEQVL
tara:strand:+ start:154 stop:312 length:159 start_codon:yes stop_codon:yes gene_type:complete